LFVGERCFSVIQSPYLVHQSFTSAGESYLSATLISLSFPTPCAHPLLLIIAFRHGRSFVRKAGLLTSIPFLWIRPGFEHLVDGRWGAAGSLVLFEGLWALRRFGFLGSGFIYAVRMLAQGVNTFLRKLAAQLRTGLWVVRFVLLKFSLFPWVLLTFDCLLRLWLPGFLIIPSASYS
jgi:hypothetical protein